MRTKRLTRILIGILVFFALSLEPRALSPAYAASKGNPPVAHWKFDEGGGTTAYDETSNNNDGTLVGDTKFVPGKIGKALQFDGTDDYVNVSDSASLDATTKLSVEFWMKSSSVAAVRVPISKWNYQVSGSWGFQMGNPIANNEIGVFILDSPSDAGYQYGKTTDVIFVTDTWYHVSMVYNGDGAANADKLKIYVNGIQKTLTFTGTIPVSLVNSVAPVRIGAVGLLGDRNFYGLIDDVRIYNYARSADQILVDYNAGSAAHLGAGTDPNEGNPPVAYWPLDENTGTTAYDRSGNGNNLTLNSSQTWVVGKSGSALSFNANSVGAIGSVSAGSSLDDINNAITMEGWIYSRSTTVKDIFGFQGYNPKWGYTLTGFIDGGNIVQLRYMNSAGSWVGINSTNPIVTPNTWQHIAVTYDGTTVKFYRDGKLFESKAGNGVATANAGRNFYIGGRPGWENSDIIIDEVKVYNYVRTPAQIAYDYSRGKPVAHYKFDEPGGTIAHNEASTADTGVAPVGWWRMDNSWSDASGNGNTGTASGGATFSSTAKIGPYSGSFDGTDDVVIVNHATSINFERTNPFTISVWIKTSDTDGGRIVFKRNDEDATNGSQTRGYDVTLMDNGKIRCHFSSNWSTGDGFAIDSPGIVNDGNWHHIVVTHNGSASDTGSEIYVDGVAGHTIYQADTVTGAIQHTYPLYIGRDNGYQGGAPSYKLNGLIDDVRVYNYARTAEQIYNDYKTTHGTLVGDTKFTDGKIGKALQFDGTDDYVNFSNPDSLKPVVNRTYALWFYPTKNTESTILGGDNGGDGNIVRVQSGNIALYNAGTWTIVLNGVTVTGVTGDSGLAVNLNQWNYLVASQTVTTNWDNFYIGKAANNRYFGGLIDDVRIYNYARTAEQILQDYNSGSASRLGAQSAGIADPWGGALPVAWWKLNENTGVKAYDASGNNNDGTLTNGPTWTQGKNGSALSFDGDNDVVKATLSSAITGNTTLEAWVYISEDNGEWRTILGSNDNDYAVLRFTGTNAVAFTYTNDNTNSTITKNAWHHIVGLYDGTYKRLYIDGVEKNKLAVSGHSFSNIGIGAYYSQTATTFFKGKIDDVKIYNYARTQAQIAWDYNQGKPVGHWRFDEATSGAVSTGSGAIKDETTNNNGTASNTTWTYTTGKFGGALNFDGNDYVDCGNGTSLDITNAITFEAWIKLSSLNSFQHIIAKRDLTDYSYLFWINPSNIMGATLKLYNNSAAEYTAAMNALTTNTWYHLAYVFDSNTLKYYLDGNYIDQDTSLAQLKSVSSITLKIGEDVVGNYFKGLIDDVRIYNYTRTAEQIQQDYLNGVAARLGD